MGKLWGRLYAGTRHHRKLRIIRQECPDSWWIWYPLIEMAIEIDNEGFIDHIECPPMSMKQLAKELGIRSVSKLLLTIQCMTSWSLLKVRDGHIQVLSYNDRQFITDNSTERVRKYRKSLDGETFPKRNKNVSCNKHETDHNRYRTEQNRTEINTSCQQGKPVDRSNGFSISNLASLWNETAPQELARVNLPFRRSPQNLKKLKTMIGIYPEKTFWTELIEKIHHSSFLRGKNDRGWKATFDFIVTKADQIADGKYLDNDTNQWADMERWASRSEHDER